MRTHQTHQTHQTYQQWQNYKELELICDPTPVSQTRRGGVAAFLNRVLGQVGEIFAFSNEPIVSEKTDRMGNIVWQVYDPVHDESLHFDSAQAVQSWLEERNR